MDEEFSGLRKQHTPTPGEERSHSVCGDFFVKEFMLHGNGSRKQRNDLVSFEFYKNPSGCLWSLAWKRQK